jgi:Outer membrane protein beta-barrel domain
MKKIMFSILVIALTIPIIAQTGFGIKGGITSYAIKSNVDDQSYIPVAAHFGAFAQINITDVFSVQPEVLYSQQGNKYETNGVKESRNLDYVNIPIMLQANTKKGFTFEAGPEFGFLMSAKYKEDGKVISDIKQTFKGSNFSLGLGLIYRMKIGLGFGFRYCIGLSNISTVANTTEKSNGGQIGISYKFSVGKKEDK